ncbi:hypothetical protein, partial [Komagataeibacter rhaeticus]
MAEASKERRLLKKGDTQKLLLFFINDLFSNSFLRICAARRENGDRLGCLGCSGGSGHGGWK